MGPAAAVIDHAARTAAALPFDGSINGMDARLAAVHGRGDCGVKAALAAQEGGGKIEAVDGFSYRKPEDISEFGGRHSVNIAKAAKGELMMFDARTPDDCYKGPLNGFIVTGVGGTYDIPGYEKIVNKGLNAGYYQGMKGFTNAQLSVPGMGADGAVLARWTVPEPVRKLAEARIQKRMKVYNNPPKVAGVLPGGVN
jgi:hypothetical protein